MTNDMIEHFRKVLAARPEDATFEPRRYKNRRETWIPVQGEKVTVWRMSSYDPDREVAHPGTFLSETESDYWLQMDDHETPQKFRKRNDHKAILWRLDTRERGQITETER